MEFVVGLLILGFVIFATTRLRRGHRGVGPGATGAVYDMLNEDKRKAIEIILEERAEARDPEHKDGNLPELEDPKAPRPRRRDGAHGESRTGE
jgi:hypothetical protein